MAPIFLRLPGRPNLSNPALTSGLEWNIKVAEKDSFDIIKKIWQDEQALLRRFWKNLRVKKVMILVGTKSQTSCGITSEAIYKLAYEKLM